MLSWTNATPEVGAGTILGPGHLDAHVTRRIALPDSPVIERCWWLTWDLDTALSNSTIPGLSVQLTWEEKVTRGVPGGFLLTGPTTRRFDVTLEGRGQVLGVRFLPGAFTGVTGIPAGDLTDRTRPAAGVFSLPDVPDPEDMVRAVEARGSSTNDGRQRSRRCGWRRCRRSPRWTPWPSVPVRLPVDSSACSATTSACPPRR